MRMIAAAALATACFLARPPAWAAGTETFLYSFPKSSTGLASPDGPLSYLGGTFYGEAFGNSRNNGGVFSLNSSGTLATVYQFKGSSGGGEPGGGLTYASGSLFGVTEGGGTGYGGTVFALSSASGFRTLYNFADATRPLAPPTMVNGVLYGTTSDGGATSGGTLYSVTTAGVETLLHSFGGLAAGDGAEPVTALVAIGSTLYGTTLYGGTSTACHSLGCGTLFASDLSGNVTVLHSFDGTDGSLVAAPLLDVDGTLYGVAEDGGSANCGTAFSYVPATGTFTLLHSFAGGTGDVCTPATGLALLGSTLYGGAATPAPGSIYALTPAGASSVDFVFDATGNNGVVPVATLTPVDGTLWGNSGSGGAANYGAIYAIKP